MRTLVNRPSTPENLAHGLQSPTELPCKVSSWFHCLWPSGGWASWNAFTASTKLHRNAVAQAVFWMWWYCGGWTHLLCPLAHHCPLLRYTDRWVLRVSWCVFLALEIPFDWTNAARLQCAFEVKQGGLLFSLAWSLCSHLVGFYLQEIGEHSSLEMSSACRLMPLGKNPLTPEGDCTLAAISLLSVHSILIRNLSSAMCCKADGVQPWERDANK